jgi:hypothetical protein
MQQTQGEMGRRSGGQSPKGKPRSQELFKLEDVPMEWRQHRRLVRSSVSMRLDISLVEVIAAAKS